MPESGGVFGAGSTAEQLFVWQVVAQVIGVMLSPAMTELSTIANSAFQNVKLTPAQAATASNRSFMDSGSALAEAQAAGLNEARFTVMRQLAGNAPAPEELAAALRRGAIPETGSGPDSISFIQGIAEGNLLDKWAPVIKEIAKAIPSPADIIDAQLKGQVTESEAQALYAKVGGDEQYRQLLVDVAGSPPSPSELTDLANRGIIPWDGTGPGVLSVQQGIFEGRTKDKWQPVYKQLAQYRPPPETIRAMLEAGAFDVTRATQLWSEYGMTPQVIQEYITAANNTKNIDTRGLTQQAVLQMYYNQLLSQEDARKFLSLFGIDQSNADLLIAYTDMQRSIAAVTTAVSRIQTLYTGHKITEDTARQSLDRLKVPGTAVDGLITTWNIVASANVKTLTETQIADAFKAGIMPLDQASGELQAIGYTPYDAWVILALKDSASAGPAPAATIGAPLGTIIPGVT